MSLLRVLAAVVLLGGGFFALYELVESPRSDAFEPVLTHGSGHVVALTFDDGPTRGVTDGVLDVLRREHVPATSSSSAARRAASRAAAPHGCDGDEIENHSETHAHLNALSQSALDAQIGRTPKRRSRGDGTHARWLRPPFGARNAAVLDAARGAGLGVVLWTAMLDETSPHADPEALAATLLAQVGDGAIVVLHDGDQGRDDGGERAYEARAGAARRSPRSKRAATDS